MSKLGINSHVDKLELNNRELALTQTQHVSRCVSEIDPFHRVCQGFGRVGL